MSATATAIATTERNSKQYGAVRAVTTKEGEEHRAEGFISLSLATNKHYLTPHYLFTKSIALAET